MHACKDAGTALALFNEGGGGGGGGGGWGGSEILPSHQVKCFGGEGLPTLNLFRTLYFPFSLG